MSDICSKRGCTYSKFEDDKYCILHCDKKDFDDSNISLFWNKFNEVYPFRIRYNVVNKEVIIENINFPKFRTSYHGNYFLNIDINYPKSVVFKNCKFFDTFDAKREKFSQVLSFQNCMFYGDIYFKFSKFLELNYCEFKNDFLLENFNCKNLDIKNTKFIKNSDIRVEEKLNIDENSIFRGDCHLYGNGSSDLNCQNSQFDKELIIDNIFTVNIDSLVLKSNISFLEGQDKLNLKNTIFPKNITFARIHLMSLENVEVNDLSFFILSELKINNSKVLGKLEFTQNLGNLTIQDSTFKKEIKSADIKEINFDQVEFNEDINFIGIHNDINMNKCIFNKLRINTTHTININESSFLNIELFGETYQNLNFKNIKIQDNLEINNAKEVSLSILEANLLKSIGQKSESFIVNASSILRVNLQSDINDSINFDNCRIKEIVNIDFKQSKTIVFNRIEENPTIILNSKEYTNIDILDSKLRSLYINAYEYLEEEEEDNNGGVSLTNTIIKNDVVIPNINFLSSTNNKFYGKVNISKIEGNLELQSCIFKDEVDFSQGVFNIISIKSSRFVEKLDFYSSQISKINIIGQDLHCVFKSQVKFDNCKITDISVLNSDFDDEITFNNINSIILADIQSTKIEKLNIYNSTILNLFQDTQLLSINEFLLDTVKLSSNDTDNDIDIEDIAINDFKCNKLTIQNDLNFNEMKINKLRISNSNVEKVFRIRYSKINNIFFTDTTFEDLQIIENKNDKFEE